LKARLEEAFDDAYRIEQDLGDRGLGHQYAATELASRRRVVVTVLASDGVTELGDGPASTAVNWSRFHGSEEGNIVGKFLDA
jgi:hypothetical protein